MLQNAIPQSFTENHKEHKETLRNFVYPLCALCKSYLL